MQLRRRALVVLMSPAPMTLPSLTTPRGGGEAFPRPSPPAGACAHSRHHPPAVQGALPGAQEQPRPFARPQADRVRPADPRADARPDAPSDTHAPLRPVPCSRTSKKQHGNMMSDAVFASALGCLGGVATRKAGVQCTAWRGTAGESWGSGRSARADMAGGAVSTQTTRRWTRWPRQRHRRWGRSSSRR